VASTQAEHVREKAVRRDRLGNGQDRRQRFVLGLHARRAALCRVERIGQYPRDGLAVEHDFRREQRFVMAVGAAVRFAGRVVPGQRRGDAGFFERWRYIEAGDACVRVGGQDRPGMEQVRKAADQIIGVQRRAGHVGVRAFMRPRSIVHAHDCDSHQNFSTTDWHTCSRYAREPR
jgi:hypothetical protein